MITKVCGMKHVENVQAIGETLQQQGNEAWMGFIFYPPSPRSVNEAHLAQAIKQLPTSTKRVGVFVNEKNDIMLQKAKTYSFDLLQLHGEESPEQVSELKQNIRVIKALPIRDSNDLQESERYQIADYLIFDTKGPKRGGNGSTFDWSVLAEYNGKTPFLLSGGIGLEQTEALMAFSHPCYAGVDLNSRFEKEPGVKDAALLQHFLENIRSITKTQPNKS